MSHLDDLFEQPLLRDLLRSKPLVFIDVGAAGGVQEPWLSLLRPEFTVLFAFEPHPENYRKIVRLPNGTYIQKAISDRRGNATFFLHGTQSSLIDPSGDFGVQLDTIEVETDTLEHLRVAGTIPSLDVIKTDCEKGDYLAVAGAGSFLAAETLAVQCEFSFRGDASEHPFRDYDRLLTDRGFLLFALSMQRGAAGELAGGNFLYLKSIAAILASADSAAARDRTLKLFTIALGIRHLNYAYLVARVAGDAGILSQGESAALAKLGLRRVFVPDAIRPSKLRVRIAALLGAIASLVAGQYWRAVSTPDCNRLDNPRILTRAPNVLFRRSRVKKLYDTYCHDFARRHLAQLPTRSPASMACPGKIGEWSALSEGSRSRT